jgi:hypothetical protein
MAQEESIKERIDGERNKRREVYFGERADFRNLLAQYQKLRFGTKAKEFEPIGLKCFEDSCKKCNGFR